MLEREKYAERFTGIDCCEEGINHQCLPVEALIKIINRT